MSSRIEITPLTTKVEFITEVAKKCLSNMKEEDKEYMIKHPSAGHYHFSLGLYIRNNYLYNSDYMNATFSIEPDYMSGDIIEMILSMVVPDYEYDDNFTDELFLDEQYRSLREEYYKKYKSYPTEVLDKYRDNFNQIYDAVIKEWHNLEFGTDDWDEYMEYINKVVKQLINPVIKELMEKLEKNY